MGIDDNGHFVFMYHNKENKPHKYQQCGEAYGDLGPKLPDNFLNKE